MQTIHVILGRKGEGKPYSADGEWSMLLCSDQPISHDDFRGCFHPSDFDVILDCRLSALKALFVQNAYVVVSGVIAPMPKTSLLVLNINAERVCREVIAGSLSWDELDRIGAGELTARIA